MKLTKIGEFLKRSKIAVDILDDEHYNRVTIRINHNGVSLRDNEIGKKIGTKKQFILKSGQFILSKIDARYGAFGIAPEEVEGSIITGNFWAYDVDKKKVNIDWFNQFTNSPVFYEVCERASSGITHRKYLDEKFFLNYEIMLPSVGEQLIQIEKIKVQKISFGELSTELNHQLTLVKKLRQQLLQDAVQGKLSAEFRSSQPELVEGSHHASELLKKIKAEKATLRQAQGTNKKEKELPPIKDEEIPFEIPKGWVWCRLGECINLKSGQDLTPNQYSDIIVEGLPYITGASNLENEKVIVNRWTKEPKSIAINGELLLTCKGAGIGKMAWLELKEVHIARQIMALSSVLVLLKYIKIVVFLNIPNFQRKAKSLIPGIDRETVLTTLLPLPPLSEQHRIVQKLDKLMQTCDALEASIKESAAQNEKLLQQVLREALRKSEG